MVSIVNAVNINVTLDNYRVTLAVKDDTQIYIDQISHTNEPNQAKLNNGDTFKNAPSRTEPVKIYDNAPNGPQLPFVEDDGQVVHMYVFRGHAQIPQVKPSNDNDMFISPQRPAIYTFKAHSQFHQLLHLINSLSHSSDTCRHQQLAINHQQEQQQLCGIGQEAEAVVETPGNR
ncbi:hypothetical protein ACLKA6_012945 [Drosophila palustris]